MIEYKEVRDWEDPAEPVVAYRRENAVIPNDSSNRQYRMMQALVAEGEAMILPSDKPSPPPESKPTLEERVAQLEAKLEALTNV